MDMLDEGPVAKNAWHTSSRILGTH